MEKVEGGGWRACRGAEPHLSWGLTSPSSAWPPPPPLTSKLNALLLPSFIWISFITFCVPNRWAANFILQEVSGVFSFPSPHLYAFWESPHFVCIYSFLGLELLYEGKIKTALQLTYIGYCSAFIIVLRNFFFLRVLIISVSLCVKILNIHIRCPLIRHPHNWPPPHCQSVDLIPWAACSSDHCHVSALLMKFLTACSPARLSARLSVFLYACSSECSYVDTP